MESPGILHHSATGSEGADGIADAIENGLNSVHKHTPLRPIAVMKCNAAVPIILLLLLAGSGCAALIYEIVWFQLLQLVIGSSAVSLGLLLAAYMGGLCVGSAVLPRLLSARWNPLRVYACLELGVGAFGFAILFGLPFIGRVYAGATPGMAALVARGAVSAVCLVPPTLLMGASFPAIARWVEGTSKPIAWMGALYSANVAGAVVTLTRHVQSFFQGNRWLLEPLAARVLAQVPDGRVIDLYAGAGLFSVSLAASGRCSITAVEGDRFSARDLKHNAAPFAGVMTVSHASVEQFLASGAIRDARTAVLDPPRTGVSGEAISGILALKVPRVVYVSCDVATLARDVKRFVQAGYRLEHIEAFDLFPNTAHVETLAVLVH